MNRVQAALKALLNQDSKSTPPIRKAPTRYVTVDVDGHPVGFFSDDMHTAIPADAKKITEAQYLQFHEGQGANPPKRHKLIGDALVEHVPELTMEQKAIAAMIAGLTVTLKDLGPVKFPTGREALHTIGLVTTVASLTGAFPDGAKTYPMRDSAGHWQRLSVHEYISVSTAISSYVATLRLIADGNPLGATELPHAEIDLS